MDMLKKLQYNYAGGLARLVPWQSIPNLHMKRPGGDNTATEGWWEDSLLPAFTSSPLRPVEKFFAPATLSGRNCFL